MEGNLRQEPGSHDATELVGGMCHGRFLQILGVDCGGNFAPVCKLQSIRMMLAIAAELDYEVHMLDLQTAYSTPTSKKTGSSRWRPVTRPTTKQEFL